MYDKTLDSFRAVAEEGSFSKAAERLYITHTGVIKQISSLEERLGVKLFDRTTHGVSLTPAGQTLYSEALPYMKEADKIIRKVRQAQESAPKILRIGSSLLSPCHLFMDLWDEIRDKCPQFSLKIISFEDEKNRRRHIGETFDFIVGVFDDVLKNDPQPFMPVGAYRFCIAVPRSHPLSKKKLLALSDLKHYPLMIMREGTSPVNDRVRKEITDHYPDIPLVDIDPTYTIATFNHAVERDCLLLSLECWDRIHPDIRTIPLKEDYRLPYGIIYSKDPEPDMLEFLETAGKYFKAQS
ncbi:MAG: LysR family transcriptional regulator [Firmicutes bacterium]|nr:LysR family transcriptional regulator [Bacillota bacterium]